MKCVKTFGLIRFHKTAHNQLTGLRGLIFLVSPTPPPLHTATPQRRHNSQKQVQFKFGGRAEDAKYNFRVII